MNEPQRIITSIGEPVHVTLTKNTKGYQWDISVFGADADKVLATIKTVDANLKTEYGAVEA